MRGIKFRVPFIDKCGSYFAYFEDLWGITQEEYTAHKLDWDNAQQYIGLKDKNGVEIYEGDIVEVPNCYQKNYIIAAIDPLEGATLEDGCDGYIKYRPCIVIGNTYENPELMEVTHDR